MNPDRIAAHAYAATDRAADLENAARRAENATTDRHALAAAWSHVAQRHTEARDAWSHYSAHAATTGGVLYGHQRATWHHAAASAAGTRSTNYRTPKRAKVAR